MSANYLTKVQDQQKHNLHNKNTKTLAQHNWEYYREDFGMS
jgi:hypothetical protein